MTQPTWTDAHAATLKALREAMGLDLFQVAKRHSLSVNQVRQLEEGGESAFYTPHIKWTVGRKLTLALGGSCPDPQAAPDSPAPDDTARPTTLHASAPDNHAAPTPSERRRLDLSPALKEALLPRPKAHRPIGFAWGLGGTLSLILVVALSWAIQDSTPVRPQAPQGPALALAKESAPEPIPDSAPTASEEHERMVNVVATAVSESVNPMAPHPSLSAAPIAEGCRWSSNAPDLTPAANQRPDNYVHVEAQSTTTVCWRDADKKTRLEVLKPNDGVSFWGTPPFQVYASDPARLKVYFKGQLVRWPIDTDTLHIVLGTRQPPAH